MLKIKIGKGVLNSYQNLTIWHIQLAKTWNRARGSTGTCLFRQNGGLSSPL